MLNNSHRLEACIDASVMTNKVPAATIAFWIIKILATTVGETGADYLAVHVGLGSLVTGAITAAFLGLSLVWQLRQRQYVPWIYWLTVVLLSVVGTQITDALTDGLGVTLYFDSDLVVPDPALSLKEGAIAPWASTPSPYYDQTLDGAMTKTAKPVMN